MRAEDVYAILNKRIKAGGGGAGGTTNYNILTNKPIVNGVTLLGSLKLEDLGISEINNEDIDRIINDLGGL